LRSLNCVNELLRGFKEENHVLWMVRFKGKELRGGLENLKIEITCPLRRIEKFRLRSLRGLRHEGRRILLITLEIRWKYTSLRSMKY
jgi:hypothetical protein